MADWGLLAEAGGRVTLYGADGTPSDHASPEAAATAFGIARERLIVLGGAPARVPAAILPEMPGPLPGVVQASPAALLPPEARLLIAGALANGPDWEGIICLPEDEVTHWVHVSAREIVSMQGAATGRLAQALGAGGDVDTAAMSDTMARPERLAAHLNAAMLSGGGAVLGHLLGAELAAMRPYWLGQDVRVIGDGGPYAAALEAQGVIASAIPKMQAWRDGLSVLSDLMSASA